MPAGTAATQALRTVAPSAKTVDGPTADWRGRLPGFGGAVLYSRGELLYQDHLFDACGPDDGRDAQRLAVHDPMMEALPETYRIEPALQTNLPGEFGVPVPEQFEFSTHYGDLEGTDQADLSELRLAATEDDLFVLGRTTTMLEGGDVRSALLVLIDSGGDEGEARRGAVRRRHPDHARRQGAAPDREPRLGGRSSLGRSH